jgi:hypothetical protein
LINLFRELLILYLLHQPDLRSNKRVSYQPPVSFIKLTKMVDTGDARNLIVPRCKLGALPLKLQTHKKLVAANGFEPIKDDEF